MKKTKNETTGEVTFSFTDREIKKIKAAGLAVCAIFVLSLGTAVYSAVSMNTLRNENELYKNQLKMAEEKMDALADKTKTIEKMSGQLQDMIKANNNGAGQNISTSGEGGQGGASTVPDKARNVKASEHENVSAQEGNDDISTPGQLLSRMRKLDQRLDSQIKTMIVLREKLLNQTYGSAAPPAPSLFHHPRHVARIGHRIQLLRLPVEPRRHRLHLP